MNDCVLLTRIFQWQLKWVNKGAIERNPVLRLPSALYTGCIRRRNTFEIPQAPLFKCTSYMVHYETTINHSSSFFCVHLPLTLWLLSSRVETYFLAPWTKADIVPCLAKKSKTELGQIHVQVWSDCLSWNLSQPPWRYLNWSAEGWEVITSLIFIFAQRTTGDTPEADLHDRWIADDRNKLIESQTK